MQPINVDTSPEIVAEIAKLTPEGRAAVFTGSLEKTTGIAADEQDKVNQILDGIARLPEASRIGVAEACANQYTMDGQPKVSAAGEAAKAEEEKAAEDAKKAEEEAQKQAEANEEQSKKLLVVWSPQPPEAKAPTHQAAAATGEEAASSRTKKK